MRYAREFRAHWRALAGATLGMGSAVSVNGYAHSILAPHLLAEYGWSKAAFALMGSVYLVAMIFIPISGRLADMIGARRAILIGATIFPLTWFALPLIHGDIRLYFALNVAQLMFCSTTTATVYCRVVAERFEAARGVALGIMASGPALVGALGSPLLAAYADSHGWRAAAIGFGLFSAAGSVIALLLIPSVPRTADGTPARRSASADYGAILRKPIFWLLFSSTFLCCLPYALAQSQLNLMLVDKHLAPTAAGLIVSTFATGVIVGRFALGGALDRFPTHWVAFVGLALSGVGLWILASPTTQVAPLILGVAMFGLSFGAEGDIVAYAVVRYFGMETYSTVLGLLIAAAGAAMTVGAVLLSFILARTDSYSLFMAIAGASAILGAANLLRLRGFDRHVPSPPATGEAQQAAA